MSKIIEKITKRALFGVEKVLHGVNFTGSTFSQYTFGPTNVQSSKRLCLSILKLGFIGATLLAANQNAYASNSQLSCKSALAKFSESGEFIKSESAKELGDLLDSVKIAETQKTEVLEINQNMNSEIASLGFSHEQILWVNSMIANLFEAYGVNEYKRTEGQSSILKYKYMESRNKLIARSLELLPEERKVDSAKLSDVRRKLQSFIDEKMKLYNYVFIHSEEKKEIDRRKEQKRKDEKEQSMVVLDSYVARDPTGEELALIMDIQTKKTFPIRIEEMPAFNVHKYQSWKTNKIEKIEAMYRLSWNQFVSIYAKIGGGVYLGYWTRSPSGELSLIETTHDNLHLEIVIHKVSDRQLVTSSKSNEGSIILWTFNMDRTVDKLVLAEHTEWVDAFRVLSPNRFVSVSIWGTITLWKILPSGKVDSKLYKTSGRTLNGDSLVMSDSNLLVYGNGNIDYWNFSKAAGEEVTRFTIPEGEAIHVRHIKISDSEVIFYTSDRIKYDIFDEKGLAKSFVEIAGEGAKFSRVEMLSKEKIIVFLSDDKARIYTLPDLTAYTEYDFGRGEFPGFILFLPISESKFFTKHQFHKNADLWSLESNGVFVRKTIKIPKVEQSWLLEGLMQEDGAYLTEGHLPVLYSSLEHKVFVPERVDLLKEEKKTDK